MELKKRKLKTVYNGFFVSSGELEVQKDQNFREKKSVSKQSQNEIKKMEIPSFLLENIILGKMDLKRKKKKKMVNNNNENNNENKIENNCKNDGMNNDIKTNAIEGGKKKENKDVNKERKLKSSMSTFTKTLLDGTMIVVPRVRVIKQKPEWIPTVQTIEALESFKVEFSIMKLKINKNGLIPLQVILFILLILYILFSFILFSFHFISFIFILFSSSLLIFIFIFIILFLFFVFPINLFSINLFSINIFN